MSANGAVTAPPQTPRRDRFASGAQVRLELTDGDWVAVRAELTYGQQRRLAAAGLTGVPEALAQQGQGESLSLDLARYDIERLVTWVLDWSFRDADGDHVVVSREAIEALHPDTAAELQQALDRHVEALEAKKAPGALEARPGASAPAVTSSSARRSAGAGRR